MKYSVIARDHRPKNFKDMVGQTHVTTSLKNAITYGRIGQSYLFSGPRGVGKTSLARIMVKSLNCNKGPTDMPCNKCEICREIEENRSLDYAEIDGASNRGIDQIRELTDGLKYASPRNKYRIFVIDEVHMLTIEAFNALLKSLEEPPPKVIFIFCTTQPHKVPATIKSRCQHYHFKLFDIETIKNQLRKILKEEKISFEEDGLFHIAKGANGSLRDSQSILDQVIAYGGGEIKAAEVLDVLGLNPTELYINFIRHLHQEQLSKNYKFLNDILSHGKDIEQFIYELISCLNSILFIKEGITDINLLALSQADFQSFSSFKNEFSKEEIFLLIDICLEFIRELRLARDERVTAQLFIVKLHRYKNLITPETLKSELLKVSAGLEKEHAGGITNQSIISKDHNDRGSPKKDPQKIKSITGLDYNMVCGGFEKNDPEMFDISKSFEFSSFKDNMLILRNTIEMINEEIVERFKTKIAESFREKYMDKIIVRIDKSEKNDSLKNALKVFGGKVTENNLQK